MQFGLWFEPEMVNPDSDLARAHPDWLLQTGGLGQYRMVPARVIAMGPVNGLSRSVTVDAGSLDGIRPNQTVMNAQGLVGRVR